MDAILTSARYYDIQAKCYIRSTLLCLFWVPVLKIEVLYNTIVLYQVGKSCCLKPVFEIVL